MTDEDKDFFVGSLRDFVGMKDTRLADHSAGDPVSLGTNRRRVLTDETAKSWWYQRSSPNVLGVTTPEPTSPCPISPNRTLVSSVPSSHFMFAEPKQTLVFFDWDDTLFPTTELFDRWGFSSSVEATPDTTIVLTPQQERQFAEWREALRNYLEEACSLSDMVAIVTNSRRPWVTTCLERFAPDLLPFFAAGRVKVIYAFEKLRQGKRLQSQCMNLRPVRHREVDLNNRSEEEHAEESTHAKYVAMREVVADFYSQYSGQTWKNIISLGDMRYEHDAVQDVTFRRVPEQGQHKEHIRTKAIILPSAPTLSEITLRLRFSRHMLKAYVMFNGDLDVDLTSVANPVLALAEALGMPQLSSVSFSGHAWGRKQTPPDSEELEQALTDVEIAVHSALFD
mmetsp:Transcript_127309/g.271432  ORF Transcript_127309/g.271432 Transcript_127309/m.271432 type:complete len:395 (-) Transcript_127309:69-1253(-)